MTSLRAPPDSHQHSSGRVNSWPGVRAFRSPHFRVGLAAILLAGGLLVLSTTLMRQVNDPTGQFGIDFGDYWSASTRIVVDGVPYEAGMLVGPVAAQGLDRYRYPPPFAQLLVLGHGAGHLVAVWSWLAVQAAAIWAALWFGTGLGGARRSAERALWCGVAAVFFLPTFDTLWKGNVSGVVALQLVLAAGGGTVGGVALASAVLLRLTPLAVAPAALLGDPRLRNALLASGVAIVLVSALLHPQAWLSYGQVLVHMLAGEAMFPTNLAPAALAANAGMPANIVTTVRVVTLGTALAAVAASLFLTRRRGGWLAAVALAIVPMLLVPAALWYHYLVLALVPAALAWPRARSVFRITMIFGAGLVSLGLVALPLATLGASLMIGVALASLWPTSFPSEAR